MQVTTPVIMPFVLLLLIIFICIIGVINVNKYLNNMKEQKEEDKIQEEEEKQRLIQEEKERRKKMLDKAGERNSTYQSKLEDLYKELERAQISYALSIGSTMLSIQAAYQPVKKHDPYIRGGMASAIGGSALGVYTALKTDEENRRNEEAHNEAQERLVQKRNKEFNAKLNYENISDKITNLEKRIEKELDMLNKTSELSHEYYVESFYKYYTELKSLYDKHFDVDNSIEYYRTKPYNDLDENEKNKLKDLCKKNSKLRWKIEEIEKKIETEYQKVQNLPQS